MCPCIALSGFLMSPIFVAKTIVSVKVITRFAWTMTSHSGPIGSNETRCWKRWKTGTDQAGVGTPGKSFGSAGWAIGGSSVKLEAER